MELNKKREEIREGIAVEIGMGIVANFSTDKIAGYIMRKLHSQGCVLKVDRPYIRGATTNYIAVEPLIEEERDADTAES